MGKQNEFEMVFRDFVSGFGGEVLPEPSDTKIADYVFHKHKIVAELKCLMEDQTDAMNKKVKQIVQDWWRKHKKIPEGYDSSKPLEIATAQKEIADRWLEILKTPIENFITLLGMQTGRFVRQSDV
jgi:DNA phosphorothioation-dependent restriction protein DptG